MAGRQWELKIFGFKELEENLRRLPMEVAGKVLRSALRKASQPMTDQWSSNAPRSDVPSGAGHAADSIKTRSMDVSNESDNDVEIKLWVGPDRNHFYLMFHEFGTRFLPARADGRQAFDSNTTRIIREFGSDLGKKIEDAARRLHRSNKP